MKPNAIVITTLGLAAMLAAIPGFAQTPAGSGPAPILHVHTSYRSCHFDLHPELTKAEFEEFAEELGSVLRFRQLGDTSTLGRGRLDLSLQLTSSGIDDSKGAWNNTMSHPTADHYLGEALVIPRLVVRLGVSDRVDIGAWGGMDPHSNYGLVGVDTTVVMLRQDAGQPVSVSVRPSIGALVGPKELWAGNASLDVSVSRSLGAFAVYVGGASSASVAVERSDDVDLEPATAAGSVGYAGLTWTWRGLLVAAEVEKGALVSFGVRIGRRF